MLVSDGLRALVPELESVSMQHVFVGGIKAGHAQLAPLGPRLETKVLMCKTGPFLSI